MENGKAVVHSRKVHRQTFLPVKASRIRVNFQLTPRQKGLLWYSTYAVSYTHLGFESRQLFFSLMSTLVECVPNFSEGCDQSKVDAIVAAMKMDGVYLLDREMDADHNRSVITLVGEREAIQEAAIRGVGKASELIDLNVHKGAHPRMGATDVVPVSYTHLLGFRRTISSLTY